MNKIKSFINKSFVEQFFLSRALLGERKKAPLVMCGFCLMWMFSSFSMRVFTPIPMTLQTCGLLIISTVMNPGLAFLSMSTWIFAGACGVPCFASGSGLSVILGPSGGSLWGYLFAAPIVSALLRGERKHSSDRLNVSLRNFSFFRLLFSGMLGASLVLFCGWFYLSMLMGPQKAYTLGVAPFWLSDMAKVGAMSIIIKNLFGTKSARS